MADGILVGKLNQVFSRTSFFSVDEILDQIALRINHYHSLTHKGSIDFKDQGDMKVDTL